MAIGIFKSLIFGDVDSADYGIYITGEAVYNAPQRAVEMVTVPGRNGAIALDQGRWENIEVSYPAGCFGGDQSDFASKISDFRNAIVSQLGYQRLTDEYNPNEYRLGTYLSGLDVKPKSMGRAGEFTITFDCKPQRWLTSGEAEITVTSGQKLFNPTPYASSPLLAIEGYGNISISGYDIELENAVMGNVHYSGAVTRQISNTLFNAGDVITCSNPTIRTTVSRISPYTLRNVAATITDSNSLFRSHFPTTGGNSRDIVTNISDLTFYAGTPRTITNTATIVIPVSNNGTNGTATVTLTQTIKQTVSEDSILLSISQTSSITYTTSTRPIQINGMTRTLGPTDLDSTVSLLGHPTYIDCDVGECYRIDGGEYVSLNGKVTLGSDLPVLATGENKITFDNTVTELKIAPNWWKL